MQVTFTMTSEEYRLIKALRNGDPMPLIEAYGVTWHCCHVENGKPCPFGAADFVSCFRYHRVMKENKNGKG